ncbi:unnamed protein product [Durusdinium trenchii]|uniref:Uncharacterized protein n=1 Tax=Durusdinium trenchii TaxID=1381693 RepID=A0ABP0MWA8_9DINO
MDVSDSVPPRSPVFFFLVEQRRTGRLSVCLFSDVQRAPIRSHHGVGSDGFRMVQVSFEVSFSFDGERPTLLDPRLRWTCRAEFKGWAPAGGVLRRSDGYGSSIFYVSLTAQPEWLNGLHCPWGPQEDADWQKTVDRRMGDRMGPLRAQVLFYVWDKLFCTYLREIKSQP